MTSAPQSGGVSLARKVVAALVLVPLAIVIIAFAVANREIVTVSLDPFSTARPAASLTLPLFGLIIVLLIVGVLIGGVAAWLRQSKWRRAARRLRREVGELRAELDTFKRTDAAFVPPAPPSAAPPERLKLKPPL